MEGNNNNAGCYTITANLVDTFAGIDGSPAQLRIRKNVSISVCRKTGTILSIESCNSRKSVNELDPDSRNFFTPGFVDTHVHAPQYSFTGSATDKPLMGPEGWLESYTFPAERSMANNAKAKAVYNKLVEKLLRSGTTTALYFGTIDNEPNEILAQVCAARGQRACIGKVCMDINSPHDYCETTSQSLEATKKFIDFVKSTDSFENGMLLPVITPRFIPTCSIALLQGLGKLAKSENVLVQSHLSESNDEVAFSAALHPSFKSDAELFDSCGLLENSVMAHCVHCTDEDLVLMKKRGCSIAHCPLSNFFFANGILDARRIQRSGVTLGLGTDVAGGYAPTMLSAMRNAVIASLALQKRKQNNVTWVDALHLATRGGADALRMPQIGRFDVGMKFDAILWNPAPTVDVFEGDTFATSVEKTLNIGDDRNIAGVWVNGIQRISVSAT